MENSIIANHQISSKVGQCEIFTYVVEQCLGSLKKDQEHEITNTQSHTIKIDLMLEEIFESNSKLAKLSVFLLTNTPSTNN